MCIVFPISPVLSISSLLLQKREYVAIWQREMIIFSNGFADNKTADNRVWATSMGNVFKLGIGCRFVRLLVALLGCRQ